VKKTRVVIVEDEMTTAQYIREILINYDFDVTGTYSGMEDFDSIINCRPDMVLLDIFLEGETDGVLLAEHIQQVLDVPIVFITADTGIQTFQRAKGTSPYAYITKPVDPFSLFTTVEIALYKHSIDRKYRHEIEERKRLEQSLKEKNEALAEQREFLRNLIDNIPDPVFYKDTDGKYTGCNTAYEAFFGMTREKIIGKTVHDIAPPVIADRYSEKDLDLFRKPGMQVYTSKVENSSGEIRDVEFRKALFRKRDGETAGIIGVITDLTESLKLQRAIITITDEERRRIGRDLHDGLGQYLTGISMMLGALKSKLDKKMPVSAEEITGISREVEEAIDMTRVISRGLSPVSITTGGIVPALADLARNVNVLGNVYCVLNAEKDFVITDRLTAVNL